MIKLDPNNAEHRSLARLVLARRDWEAALAAVKHARKVVKNTEDSLFHPFSTAIVICYSRPFIGARNYPKISSKYETFDDPKMADLHAILIKQRNNVVAHANVQHNEVELIPKGTVITCHEGKGKGTLIDHGEVVSSSDLRLDALPMFESLIQYQVDRVKKKLKEEKHRLFP